MFRFERCVLAAIGLTLLATFFAGRASADVNLPVVCADVNAAAGVSCSPHKYDLPVASSLVHSGGTFKLFSSLSGTDTLEVCLDDIPRGSASDPSTGAPCAHWAYVAKSTIAAPTVNVPAVMNVSWELPTLAADGTALTGEQALTGLQLFVSTAPIADNTALAPSATFAPGITSSTYSGTLPAGATVYIRLRALNQTGAGKLSAEVSKVIELPPLSVPGVPTNVQISITITKP